MALTRYAIERYAARIGVSIEWAETRLSALALGMQRDIRFSVRRGANEGHVLRMYGGYDAPFVTVKGFCGAPDLARLGLNIATFLEDRAEQRAARDIFRMRARGRFQRANVRALGAANKPRKGA